MRDFSYKTYEQLLNELKSAKFNFATVEDFASGLKDRFIVLRHDVDSWSSNALQMAKIEAEHGIKATYYFRVSPLSYNERIIRQILDLGHELGYHYEDLSSCRGNKEQAISSFQRNLEKFRKFYPVKTIVMHGKPLSHWNNLDLWKYYDYHDYGIICEPYLDFDFNQILYLTDVGNCWDGDKYSIRDTVRSTFNFPIHSTYDLIDHLQKGLLPDQIMLNAHPSRWNDNLCKWIIRYYVLTLPKYLPKKMLKIYREKRKTAVKET